jgi:hypothetical protein
LNKSELQFKIKQKTGTERNWMIEDYSLRRIQRLIAEYELDINLIARWLAYLNHRHIRYHIRIRNKFYSHDRRIKILPTIAL